MGMAHGLVAWLISRLLVIIPLSAVHCYSVQLVQYTTAWFRSMGQVVNAKTYQHIYVHRYADHAGAQGAVHKILFAFLLAARFPFFSLHRTYLYIFNSTWFHEPVIASP